MSSGVRTLRNPSCEFEDLDLVAAVEASEFDRADRVRLRADPHAAVADHRAFDALRWRLAERPDRRRDRGGRGGRRRTLRCLADFLEWRVIVDRRQVFVDDGGHRFDDDRRGRCSGLRTSDLRGLRGLVVASATPAGDHQEHAAGAAVRARSPKSGPMTDDPSSPSLGRPTIRRCRRSRPRPLVATRCAGRRSTRAGWRHVRGRGAWLRCRLGGPWSVALAVGFAVGLAVGFAVGLAVGFGVARRGVGSAVGFGVGLAVGFGVGVGVGGVASVSASV